MFRKKIALILTLAMVASMLTACGSSNKDSDVSSSSKNEIVIAEGKEWEGVDVYQLSYSGEGQPLMSEGLLTHNQETGDLASSIATDIVISEDGKTITLTIPEGLKYANGEDVKAEDVKRSIEWGLEVSPYNVDYTSIESITVDGNKVVLSLEEFSTTILYYLSSNFMSLLDKDQIESMSEEELLTKASPYGLYSVEEFVSGSHVTLKKNENYKTLNENVENKGSAAVDKITVRFMSEGFSIVSGLKSGDVDVAFSLPTESIDELKGIEGITVEEFAKSGINYLVLNKDNKFFADESVRKAVSLSINRDLIASLNNNYVRPAYSFIVPEMLDYDEEIAKYYENTYSNDLEEAKKILKDAGFEDTNNDGYLEKNGETFEFTLGVSTESYHAKNTAQAMQLQLKEAGIKVNIEAMESGYLKQGIKEDKYDAAIRDYEWCEPASILPYIIDDSNNLENQSYYDLMYGAAKIVNSDERQSQFADAQKVLMDELALIPLLQEVKSYAYRDTVEGIKVLNDGTIIYNDLKIK